MMRGNKRHGQKDASNVKTINRIATFRDMKKRLSTLISSGGGDDMTPSGKTRKQSKDMPPLISTCASEAQSSTKLLVATKHFAALLACVERRPEAKEAKTCLAPVTNAIAAGKAAIRRKGNEITTTKSQQEAYQLIVITAKACRQALSAAIESGAPNPSWPEVSYKTASNVSESEATASASAPSNSSQASSSSNAPANGSGGGHLPFSSRVGRQRQYRPRSAPVSPGAAFVQGRAMTLKVDPRGSNLRGSGAICR